MNYQIGLCRKTQKDFKRWNKDPRAIGESITAVCNLNRNARTKQLDSLLAGLHQFGQVAEENVAVAVAETVHFVVDFAGIVVNHETRFPRFEMLVMAHTRVQFLFQEVGHGSIQLFGRKNDV